MFNINENFPSILLQGKKKGDEILSKVNISLKITTTKKEFSQIQNSKSIARMHSWAWNKDSYFWLYECFSHYSKEIPIYVHTCHVRVLQKYWFVSNVLYTSCTKKITLSEMCTYKSAHPFALLHLFPQDSLGTKVEMKGKPLISFNDSRTWPWRFDH